MIALTRDRAAVPPSFLDPARHPNLLDLFRANRDGTASQRTVKRRLEASARWSDAKPQLAIESKGKCAFCEAPVDGVYYGEVEHYRPKSRYWWLTYCYDNYLFACRLCNGKKSDQYLAGQHRVPQPDLAAAADDAALLAIAEATSPVPSDAQAIDAFTQAYALEQPHLPNPYVEDPEPLFRWVPDDLLQEVRIAPADNSQRARNAFAAAEKMVDLNRAPLLAQRWNTYRRLRRVRNLYDNGDAAEKAEHADWARELCEQREPFAAMARYFFREWQILP